MVLFDRAGGDKLVALSRSPGADARLAAEADDVAARSRAAAATLPPGHRLATFRLGYEVGWASEFAGSFAMSDPAVQAKVRAITDAHVAIAREQARRIGVDTAVDMLPSRTLTDFVRLQERFEADESGLAGRVEARLTPLHRHLFLLGAAVGGEAAKVQGSNGKFSEPPVETIRRHATLAGVAPAAWQPLAVDHTGEPPATVLERYGAALDGVMAALAADDARASARR
jgi:hypothetical protein